MGNLIEVSVKYGAAVEHEYTGDIVILMGIEKTVDISIEAAKYHTILSKGDILLINPKTSYSIAGLILGTPK